MESELLILTFFFQVAFFLILPQGRALIREELYFMKDKVKFVPEGLRDWLQVLNLL